MHYVRKLALLLAAAVVALPPLAAAARPQEEVPEWARPAVDHLAEAGSLDPETFRPNAPMRRAAFGELMRSTFGGGFKRTRGKVRAGEVDAALVRRLGYRALARQLDAISSPDGWSPAPGRWFGTEILARELGLRHNRAVGDDEHEASATEAMLQADVVYAVWRAATSPSRHNAELLEELSLESLDEERRAVVAYAFSLVGTPYVWAGEWPEITPEDYAYGAQSHGGFDCSGFVWYVLRAADEDWSPIDRPYEGWPLPQRSSAQMARSTKDRLTYEQLLPGDVVFFAPQGPDADPSSVYHAGIYLGRGWMIHSSGSRAGVSISYIGPGSWWEDEIAWGRRLIPPPQ